MTSPSQVPVRYPSGVSTDQVWGPLANFGQPNPFMYQIESDDLMGPISTDSDFVGVTSGTGAATTSVAGDGGLWLMTTSTAGAGTSGIIGQKNTFVLPPQAYTGTGLTSTLYPSKKVFFLARINVTNVAATTGYAGLIPSATTTALPTDGIFFVFTNAATVALAAYSGSTLLWSVPIPAAVLTLYYTNAAWVDIGFYMDRMQNVYAFMGYPLVGFLPASAWSGVNNVNAQPVPKAAVAAYQSVYNGAIVNPWTPTTAALTPGIIMSGAVQTAYADFILAAKER